MVKIIFNSRSEAYSNDMEQNLATINAALYKAKAFYKSMDWLYLRQVYFYLELDKASRSINPLLGWDKKQTEDFTWEIHEDEATKNYIIEVNAVALS